MQVGFEGIKIMCLGVDKKFCFFSLIFLEIEKVQTTGRLPSKEQKYADIYREKPLRVSQKVLVPIREHPKVIL